MNHYVRKARYHFRRLLIFPTLILTLESLNIVKRIFLGIHSCFVQSHKPLVIRTPDERFHGLESLGYTFKPNYADLPIGGGKTLPRVHYVDEGPSGASEVILCLHGEPSWSFLYRSMIPVFTKAGYRVIAPDFIGFGKSDKFTHISSYTHEMHTMTLRLLLDYLNIRNITLVCQDWGGLTGLSVVKDCDHLFSRIVLMNTGLPAGSELSFQMMEKVTPFLLWRGFAQLLGTAMPIEQIFYRSLLKPKQSILSAYSAPFPSADYKAGAAAWPLLVPVTSSTTIAVDMQETRNFLRHHWKSPSLIMFSDKDPITRGQEVTFKRLLPHADVSPPVKGGHFLQEDNGKELANNIINFIKK